jgi:hypothetical protein
LEELFIYLKIRSSQTNFQQFRDVLGLQDRPVRQRVIVVTEFITDDLYGFVQWYISGKTDNKYKQVRGPLVEPHR